MSDEELLEEMILKKKSTNVINDHKKFYWTEERQTELISAIEKNPLIWDVRNKGYRSAVNKLLFWHAVANAVDGKPSVNMCKKKWKALRVQFVRILKAINSKKTKHSSEESIKVTWRYYHPMKFLQTVNYPVECTMKSESIESDPLRSNSPLNESPFQLTTQSIVSAPSTTLKTARTKVYNTKCIKKKRLAMRPEDCESESFTKMSPQEHSSNDEHQRFCDMLADELRRAHAQNPECAHNLRQKLLMTVTNYWKNSSE